MERTESFLDLYFDYTSNTESPRLFHRWCAYTGVAALLGRKFFFPHGHFQVYPNMYVMLMGNPGTRKSVSIKMFKKLLLSIGYETIAANRTSKEKFLMDLVDGLESDEPETDPDKAAENALDKIFSGDSDNGPCEMFVMADEFNVFIGRGNLDFIDLLGDLWDYEGPYRGRVKNSKSVKIMDPTINILAGNTPSNFAKAFPPEVAEQGFLSRMLLIHGVPVSEDRRITFPRIPEDEARQKICDSLQLIWKTIHGKAEMTTGAKSMLNDIYMNYVPMADSRFEYYGSRRFNHLLKLCLIIAAMRYTTAIDEATVLEANTVLTFTENLMPAALGEYGRSKLNDVANKVLAIIGASNVPVEFKTIWKDVHAELDRPAELVQLISNLQSAEKIQHITGVNKPGYLMKRKNILTQRNMHIDYSFITDEEKNNYV